MSTFISAKNHFKPFTYFPIRGQFVYRCHTVILLQLLKTLIFDNTQLNKQKRHCYVGHIENFFKIIDLDTLLLKAVNLPGLFKMFLKIFSFPVILKQFDVIITTLQRSESVKLIFTAI